jgi:hypothetical protein
MNHRRLVLFVLLSLASLTIVLRVGLEVGILLVAGDVGPLAWFALSLIAASIVLISSAAALLFVPAVAWPRKKE